MFPVIDGMSLNVYPLHLDHSEPADPHTSPPPGLSAAETYTGQTVHAAQDPQSAADKTTDANKAIVAIAAELQLTYQTNPNNPQATTNAAHAISTLYGNSSQVQQWVGSALKMELQGTPRERATNEALAKVDVPITSSCMCRTKIYQSKECCS